MNEVQYEIMDADILATDTKTAEVEKAARSLLLPEGWYTSEPPSTPTYYRYNDGRRVVSLFLTLVKNDDPQVRGKLQFRFSPDVVIKEDTGKADWSTQNFVKAREAFKKATGAESTQDLEVAQFLSDYAVQYKVTITADLTNMIVGVRAVKAV